MADQSSPRIPPDVLVDPTWLRDHLTDVAVVDVRWYLDGRDGHAAYLSGHIPGAVWVDLDGELSAPAAQPGGRHPLPRPEDFAATMSRLGVGPDTPVVAYDDVGGTRAARLWWMLHVHGHRVAVLDGGIDAWPGALHTDPIERTAADFPVREWPEAALATGDEIAALAAAGRIGTDTVVLDARSAERYAGEPFAVDARYGHIPGAASMPAMANLGSDGHHLGLHALAARYDETGARTADDVIAYCGSGVTACTDVLSLHRLGITARLYVGSWSEWGADDDRPIET